MRRKILPLPRASVSDSVANELRDLIVDGHLAAGARINEVHLSKQLGVSRTPLREALARLAQEGALRRLPRIGYFVRELTLEEFEQIYPIRLLLDPEALRLAGLPPPARMDRLAAINARIEKARDPNTIIDLDDTWHFELLTDCPNQALIELIEHFARRTRRYETAIMREQRNVSMTTAHHEAILSALRRRDLAGALDALRINLQSGRAPIVEWLTARDAAREAARVGAHDAGARA